MWTVFGIVYIIVGIAVQAFGWIMFISVAKEEGYLVELKKVKVLKLIIRILFWPPYVIQAVILGHKYAGDSVIKHVCEMDPDWTMVDEEP